MTTGRDRGAAAAPTGLLIGWGLGIAGATFCLAGVVPAAVRAPVGVAGAVAGAAVLAVVTVRGTRAQRARVEPAAPVFLPEQSTATARNALARHAAAQAALLRSFDGFEAVLHEILAEHTDADLTHVTLHDCVRQLREAGLLGADELATWAAALRTRQQILSRVEATPDLPVIEHALAQMIRLQVVLTDRRRQVRDSALTP